MLEAGNAEEGLAVLESEHQPQLILLDVMMPGTRRLGDAAAHPGTPRLDPGDHVQRSGRRTVRGTRRGARCIRVRRQAVRSAISDRAGEADSSRSDRRRPPARALGRPAPRRAVQHFFVALSHIGSYGIVWLTLAVLAVVLLAPRPLIFHAHGRPPTVASAALSDADQARGRASASCRSSTRARRRRRIRFRPDTRRRASPARRRSRGSRSRALASCSICSPRLISYSRVYVGVHYPLDVSAAQCSGCSSLHLFGCFQKPCDDHRQRSEQADPDPDPRGRRPGGTGRGSR